MWVLAAVLAFVYGRVSEALADNSGAKSHVWATSLGYACMGVVGTLWLYLVVYLPYVARIDLPWSTYVPWAIPAATAAGLGAFLR